MQMMTYKNIKKWLRAERHLKNIIPLVFFDILIISMYYYEQNKIILLFKNLKPSGCEKKRWT